MPPRGKREDVEDTLRADLPLPFPFLCNFHSGKEVLEGEMYASPPPVEVLLAHCGGGRCGGIESMAFLRVQSTFDAVN